jgi:nicotinate (nicotinamide) nucleotide adenylyltransferase
VVVNNQSGAGSELQARKTVDVAVLGGAFDPPHVGHLFLAMAAIRMGFADSVWIIPSPDRPDKTMLRDFDERFDLVNTAISQVPRELRPLLTASTYERDLGVFRGSLFLMASLGRSYPDRQFGFIMGGDTLEKLGTWNDPVSGAMTGTPFLESVPCCIFARQPLNVAQQSLSQTHKLSRYVADLDTAAQQLGLDLDDLGWRQAQKQPHFYSEISSTRIRKELSSPEPDEDYLMWALGSRVLHKVIKLSQ